ncbi:MAG: pyrroloquinoline quinone biosynthesis protein PqqE [Cyanobacteria bacterium PR.3.49]|nr:pyrroloquinoline quinone biosynthesis protein PqqE [Cyanobacteria bacterium PR.3.49]
MTVIAKQRPFTITMELTHRCPLQCLYCSNPMELISKENELSLDHWISIVDQAADLSIVQANLTGGEPLAYPRLTSVVAQLKKRDIYSNLITSGIGLTEKVLEELVSCGLESIQISLQSANASTAELIAGWNAQAQKMSSLNLALRQKIPVSLNVVLHKYNIDEVGEIIDLAAELNVKRLELANTQFYGFALANRENLLPSEKQMENAVAVYDLKKKQLAAKIQMSWIIGDYLERSPKPCMGGWANQHIVVSADGTAYPCLAAGAIKTLSFPSTKEKSLQWIWEESPAFNAFRGTDWMLEPCRSCEFREKDFGGCRCQAFLLTGDAAQADPVCKLSPHHQLVEEKIKKANAPLASTKELIYRLN